MYIGKPVKNIYRYRAKGLPYCVKGKIWFYGKYYRFH